MWTPKQAIHNANMNELRRNINSERYEMVNNIQAWQLHQQIEIFCIENAQFVV